jgi:hypothetical protein
VLLKETESAVVIRDQKAIGRDKTGRAAVDEDRRFEQTGAVAPPQRLGRDLQAELPQPLRIELQHLLRSPLTLDRKGRERDQRQGKSEDVPFHGRVV